MKVLLAGIDGSDLLDVAQLHDNVAHEIVQLDDFDACKDYFDCHAADVLIVGSQFDFEQRHELVHFAHEESPEQLEVLLLGDDVDELQALNEDYWAVNDYLTKPVSLTLLSNKIEALVHNHQLRFVVSSYERNIGEHEARCDYQKALSQQIFAKISVKGCLNDNPHIHYALSTYALYLGELVLAANRTNGNLVLMVGGFAGQGIPAAVGSFPTAEVFYRLVKRDMSLSLLLLEMNARLQNLLPKGVFYRACLVELDLANHILHFWNGGLPDVILLKESGEIRNIPSSPQLPLGIITNERLSTTIENVTLSPGDKIYLSTDKLFRLKRSEDEAFDENTLRTLLTKNHVAQGNFDQLIASISEYIDDDQADQPTLIELCPAADKKAVNEQSNTLLTAPPGMRDWHLSLELNPQSLAESDPLPMLLHITAQVPELIKHKSELYTILAELYTNSLEHGVLDLDSALKQSPTGFMDYLQLKQERLAALVEGRVVFSFSCYTNDEGGAIVITVEDSGPGFDYKKALQKDFQTEGYSGRGLLLLQSLCKSIAFNESGNRIEVCYQWHKGDAASSDEDPNEQN